jgi:hypothetical protein
MLMHHHIVNSDMVHGGRPSKKQKANTKQHHEGSLSRYKSNAGNTRAESHYYI